MQIFNNYYSELSQDFYEEIEPEAAPNPSFFIWNEELATNFPALNKLRNESKPDVFLEYFSGRRLLPGSIPLATAYAGHQFGHFVPVLGDGRAHLLGNIHDLNGQAWEMQLKGSGKTPFSRRGDGRCALGPAIREYLMSEAMHALGIPSTRSLAVVLSGDVIMRETLLPGAILTRLAMSHVRVGTFEYFAARQDKNNLKLLADFAIEHITKTIPLDYLGFVKEVIRRQINLLVEWLRVGFIHGVMNTDNTSISGETIDYGPCAMMNTYHPDTVFSSIDHGGRYSFGNQAFIIQWNMARFAEALLPLIDQNTEKAVALLQAEIEAIPSRLTSVRLKMFLRKLGIFSESEGDQLLVSALLDIMEKNHMDYTLTFLQLKTFLISREKVKVMQPLASWQESWLQRLEEQKQSQSASLKLMSASNPLVIPRNHHVEEVIHSSIQDHSNKDLNTFLKVLSSPYQELQQTSLYQDPPKRDDEESYKTFCGT